MTSTSPLPRPRFRGVLHQYSFFVALAGGALLVGLAPSGKARLAAGVYAVALSGLFAVSALYHRITWSPAARRWMRRLDHSMIFVLIAGTYTPFAALVTTGARPAVVLATVWSAALAAALLKVLWIDAPKWVTVAVSMAIGSLLVATSPALAAQLGPTAVTLVVGGGALYSAGAAVYALRRPNPAPAVFGYHEIFHALVVAAAAAHFTAVASVVLSQT